MLYNVKREQAIDHKGPIDADVSAKLAIAWRAKRPVPTITTEYAAVNGMKNNLAKAASLMGVHLDNAYRANSQEYTLCHNPSEGGLIDFIECVWDQSPSTSHMATFLSSVLRQRQMSGRVTKWIVHSQGAIIFASAVEHHMRCYGSALTHHSVAVHAPGIGRKRFSAAMESAKIDIHRIRSNPFDVVPNLAGNQSGLIRSLAFLGLLFGSNGGNMAISPHTNPYTGLNSYIRQLEFSGNFIRAKMLRTYKKKRDHNRKYRRGW